MHNDDDWNIIQKVETSSRSGWIIKAGCLKKNQNASRPSEHPPVMGKKMLLWAI